MNKNVYKYLAMFILGFVTYDTLELIWDNSTDLSMSCLSGFLTMFGATLNDKFSWKMDLLLQSSVITVVATILEAIVGNIDYYFWHRNIWDYSSFGDLAWFNGKICLPFCILWFFMAFAIIFIGDAITYYWLHDDEQPEYWVFGKRIWQMPKRKCHV